MEGIKAHHLPFQFGQEILVFVVSAEDSSGNVVLSYTRAQEQKGWSEVEKMLEELQPARRAP
jgi:ribosomal protein S1